MLRTAALSYKHGRRAFAVRIDVEGLPAGCLPIFACTDPVHSVARLPNETKPPTQTPAAAAAAAPGAAFPTLTIPASAISVEPASALARRPPAEPTVDSDEEVKLPDASERP